MAVILVEAASVEEAAAQGSRLFPHAALKAFRVTYHLVILRLFYSDAFYTLYFSEKKRSRVEEAIFMAEEKALVGIIMGSESDMPNMEPCMKQLEEFGIPYEVKVASAHRKPAEVHEWASGAEGRGMRVIVAAAGKITCSQPSSSLAAHHLLFSPSGIKGINFSISASAASP